jgi:2-keto-3-deoxy-L-rhamnonate aldolase RhmA
MDATGLREPNRLKRDLAAGKVCLGATVTVASPALAEILSRVGLDWLWFDTEHTAMTLENVATMLAATNGSRISSIIRVPWNDKTMIKQALDLGPDGLIIPEIRTRAEAEAAIRAMKYPPLGERGAGLGRAQAYGMRMGEYMSSANDEVMMVAQIEHYTAVENIDDIVAVEGLDAVFIGALDLSGSMGRLGQTDDPEVEASVQKVFASCKKAGIPCGLVALGADAANRRIKEGFTQLIVGIDVVYLHGAVSAELAQINRS